MPMNAVIAYIRQTRIEKGIRQQALADAMGLSLRRVSSWEKGGKGSIRDQALLNAIVYLHIPIEDVVTLFTSEHATIEDAQALARMRDVLSPSATQRQRSQGDDRGTVRKVIREQYALVVHIRNQLLSALTSPAEGSSQNDAGY